MGHRTSQYSVQILLPLLDIKIISLLTMKIVLEFFVLSSFCWMMMDGYPVDDGFLSERQARRVALDPQGIEGLYQRLQEESPYQVGDEAERPKRRWWGNKYKDNKSYGFWITALNKAGNWKKKRFSSVPGILRRG